MTSFTTSLGPATLGLLHDRGTPVATTTIVDHLLKFHYRGCESVIGVEPAYYPHLVRSYLCDFLDDDHRVEMARVPITNSQFTEPGWKWIG